MVTLSVNWILALLPGATWKEISLLHDDVIIFVVIQQVFIEAIVLSDTALGRKIQSLKRHNLQGPHIPLGESDQ